MCAVKSKHTVMADKARDKQNGDGLISINGIVYITIFICYKRCILFCAK